MGSIRVMLVDDEYLTVTHVYSKNMWGLENGYGVEDYYVRLTPKALGMLLGAEAVPDYENGTLDLVTPEGYFDHKPPEPEPETVPSDDDGPFEEHFSAEGLWSENGLVKNHTHYIIYADDGTVLEDEVTEDDIYADCTQVARNVVMLRLHGVGNIDHLTFFHTDTKEISQLYYHSQLIEYPYVLYPPLYAGEILIVNVETGAQRAVIEDGCEAPPCLISYKMSEDRQSLTVRYMRKKENAIAYYDCEEAYRTVDYIKP